MVFDRSLAERTEVRRPRTGPGSTRIGVGPTLSGVEDWSGSRRIGFQPPQSGILRPEYSGVPLWQLILTPSPTAALKPEMALQFGPTHILCVHNSQGSPLTRPQFFFAVPVN